MNRSLSLVGAALTTLVAACGDESGEGPNPAPRLDVRQAWATTAGYVACTDRMKLEAVMQLVVDGQSDVLRQILEAPPVDCFRLRGGLDVTVVSVLDDQTLVELRPLEMAGTIWTLREALVPRETADSIP